LSCKGRTLKDGIEDIHTLGLNAMEVQFVRVNVFERFASEEEEGFLPTDVEGELIVDVLRKDAGKKKPVSLGVLNQKIQSGDILKTLVSGIAVDFKELKEICDLAKDLDIKLSLHTPYYMDLLNPTIQSQKSMENIRLTGILASGLGADPIVTHIGLYNNIPSDTAINLIAEKFKEIRKVFSKLRVDANIGVEFSGKQLIFGSLEEVLALCKKVNGVIPVVNFAHLHARTSGLMKSRDDFQKVFDQVAQTTGKDRIYAHFSGVEHEGGNERRYTPIKKGDLKFEPLAECVLNNDFEITIISGSPLLEHDAMYMKVILERVQLKKEMKRLKAEKMEKEKVAKDREKKEVDKKTKEGKTKDLAKAREMERRKAAAAPKVKPKPKPKAAKKRPVAKKVKPKAKPKAKPKKAAKKPTPKPKPKAKGKPKPKAKAEPKKKPAKKR